MYDLQAFRNKVQELCRRSLPYDDRRHAAHLQLGDISFTTIWLKGEAMPLDEVIEYALMGGADGA